MAHPFAAEHKSSQARRLSKLGAKPGKAWGHSSMFHQTNYPSTNAGTDRPMTISGGSGKKRADRAPAKFASGGSVKGKNKKGATTNIIIAGAGGGQPRPVPVPVNRPVPVPVAGAPAARPPVAPPVGLPAMAPGGGGPPMPPPGVRPPGMKAGGFVKKADGGFLKDSPSKGYPGSPHSPTSEAGAKDAVSPKKDGGAVGKAEGGAVKKRAFGGGGLGAGGPFGAMKPPMKKPVMKGKSPMPMRPPIPGMGMPGMRKGGGIKKAGAGSGLGRLAESKEAAEERGESAAEERSENRAGQS